MHDMKPFKTILLFAATLLLAVHLHAQVDYLATARMYLDSCNCEAAQVYYGLYRNTYPADIDLEIAIAVCKAQREQEEKYNNMVAFYEKALQELRAADSAMYSSMKAVYEALLACDCDKAQHLYVAWQALSGYEVVSIKNHIKKCRQQQQRTQNGRPQAIEGVQEVGNLEYYIYLEGTGMAWSVANQAAQQSRMGGHSDWRLPTVAELQVIVQQLPRDYNRYLDNCYWTSEKEGRKSYRLVHYGWEPLSGEIDETHHCIIVRSKY